MMGGIVRKYFIFLPIMGALSCAVLAQDEPPPILNLSQYEDEITVLATGKSTPLREVGQPVTVIGEQEILSVQGPDLTRVIERLPGTSFSRNGGAGGFTGMFVRGASSEQLLVLVDGVRVADIAAPGRGYDLGNLLAGNLNKIELLRGPNSVVWGADAMAGVLSVSTSSSPGFRASAEVGSDEAVYAALGSRFDLGELAADLQGTFHSGEGFSAAAAGEEDDGFRQWQLSGKLGGNIAGDLDFRMQARHSDGRLELDGFPAPDFTLADTAEEQHTRETSALTGVTYDGRRIILDANFSMARTTREYIDSAIGSEPYYRTDGKSRRAELRGHWSILPAAQDTIESGLGLDFGLSRDWSQFDDEGTEREAHLTGAHALLGWYGDSITATAGLRRDDHSTFGGAWSFGANGGYRFAPGWRIRGGYGEGFKVPSLFQSSSAFYGNPDLWPERSRAWDIGIEHGSRRRGPYLAISAFRRDSTDLINYTCCTAERPFGTYENVGEARAEGIELEAGADLGRELRLQGVYSHVAAADRTPGGPNEGRELARRPRHSATISADWNSSNGVKLGADLRIVGGSFDDAANLVPLDGYAVLTLRGSVAVSQRIELFGRVENVWDEQYQTVAGYGMQGRAGWIGARARW